MGASLLAGDSAHFRGRVTAILVFGAGHVGLGVVVVPGGLCGGHVAMARDRTQEGGVVNQRRESGGRRETA